LTDLCLGFFTTLHHKKRNIASKNTAVIMMNNSGSAIYPNRISNLFSIQYPIIQAGMIWCSGWELASAVSNAGGLGLIGSGSMYPDILREHIKKCKKATEKPFGVNVPLLYPDIDKHIDIIIEEGVKIVFTSAGNPKTWTPLLRSHGIKVVHVVSSVKFALKSEEAGVDAVVAEGFEAGGHNGREETTTMVLIPAVREAIKIPLIAAGGIGTGRAMLAAMALGADGVQIGTRFVLTPESSGHKHFKDAILKSGEGGTTLTMKGLTPVRLLHNHFFEEIKNAEQRGAGIEELSTILGRGRAKKGMFEGDIEQGELEIGQLSAYIKNIKPAAEVVHDIWSEFLDAGNNFAIHNGFCK
jgi:enoyl-[acyl-carrier protein] reductase II